MSECDDIKVLPSVEYLRECIEYDQSIGELRWKMRPIDHFAMKTYQDRWNKRYSGTLVGYINTRGYRVVSLSAKKFFGSASSSKNPYYAHRIIFKLMTGEDPPKTIDHIDGDTTNNRWANLREATQTNQLWNTRSRSDNRGAHLDKRRGKWRARIKVYGVERWLGYFDSPEQAAAVYRDAASNLHGKFYREIKK